MATPESGLRYSPQETGSPVRENTDKKSLSPEERERLILDSQPMVNAVAKRVKASLPVNVELDELVSAGNLGLLQAADRYDQNSGVKFGAYAKYRVQGEIIDSLRQLDWASRNMRGKRKAFDAAVEGLRQELGRDPGDNEIAGKLGLNDEAYREMLLDISALGPVGFGQTDPDDEKSSQLEPIDMKGESPETRAVKSQMREVLSKALESLKPKYRTVVQAYYSPDEPTMKQIGGMVGVNESRVSQMRKAALEELREALGKQGIESSKQVIN